MFEPSCQREADVREMVSRRGDDPALREHAAQCATCRETMVVAAWMRELATTSSSEVPLPDASHLWWKAELLRRWDADRRATAPLERGESVQVGIGALGAGLLLWWLWREAPNLTALFSRVNAWGLSGWDQPVTMAVGASLVSLVLIAVITTTDLFARD